MDRAPEMLRPPKPVDYESLKKNVVDRRRWEKNPPRRVS